MSRKQKPVTWDKRAKVAKARFAAKFREKIRREIEKRSPAGTVVLSDTYRPGQSKFPGLWDSYELQFIDSFELDPNILNVLLQPLRDVLVPIYAREPAYLDIGLEIENKDGDVNDGWRTLAATISIGKTLNQTKNIGDFATRTSYLLFDKISINVRRPDRLQNDTSRWDARH